MSIEQKPDDLDKNRLLQNQSKDFIHWLNINSKSNITVLESRLNDEKSVNLSEIINIKPWDYLIINDWVERAQWATKLKNKYIQKYMWDWKFAYLNSGDGWNGTKFLYEWLTLSELVSQFPKEQSSDKHFELLISSDAENKAGSYVVGGIPDRHNRWSTETIRVPNFKIVSPNEVEQYDKLNNQDYNNTVSSFFKEIEDNKAKENLKQENIWIQRTFDYALESFWKELKWSWVWQYIWLPTTHESDWKLITSKDYYKVIENNDHIFILHQCFPEGTKASMVWSTRPGKAYRVSFWEDWKINLEDISKQENEKVLKEELNN